MRPSGWRARSARNRWCCPPLILAVTENEREGGRDPLLGGVSRTKHCPPNVRCLQSSSSVKQVFLSIASLRNVDIPEGLWRQVSPLASFQQPSKPQAQGEALREPPKAARKRQKSRTKKSPRRMQRPRLWGARRSLSPPCRSIQSQPRRGTAGSPSPERHPSKAPGRPCRKWPCSSSSSCGSLLEAAPHRVCAHSPASPPGESVYSAGHGRPAQSCCVPPQGTTAQTGRWQRTVPGSPAPPANHRAAQAGEGPRKEGAQVDPKPGRGGTPLSASQQSVSVLKESCACGEGREAGTLQQAPAQTSGATQSPWPPACAPERPLKAPALSEVFLPGKLAGQEAPPPRSTSPSPPRS